MEQGDLLNALVQAKRMGSLLDEVLDISRQMAEAIDRDDQVSLHMLIAMRQDPISKLEAAEQILWDQAESIQDPAASARLLALQRGEPPAEECEKTLAGQFAQNKRRLKQVLDLDRVINQKIAREKSIYVKRDSKDSKNLSSF